MSAPSNHVLRTLAVLWVRLGPFRIYVVMIMVAVMALAAVGVCYLIAPRKPAAPSDHNPPIVKATPPPATVKTETPSLSSAARATPGIAQVSPGAEQSSSTPAAPAPPRADQELPGEVSITDVRQTEKRGPRGETFVVATIGMASRSNVEKNGVEIHVFFYDLTPANEMRPTDAQVTYQWLTPIRDWSDPAPKYLAATYLKRRPSRRALEKLRYGGFVVRVFSGGKLQDERSQPEGLLALLRANTPPASTPSIAPIVSPGPAVASSSTPPKNIATIKPTPSPTASPSSRRSLGEGGTLPYGKPIPGKPGFVQSPYDPKFTIDVRGFPPGTLVNDPNTNKPFRIP